MNNTEDLIKRAEDLAARCEKTSTVTCTNFLTPAECLELKHRLISRKDIKCVIYGGADGCERCIAFFLPWYTEPEELDYSIYISAIKIQSFFGEPGHRDYLGAVLGLGIGREWIGDIFVENDTALLFCLPSVARTIVSELDKVGRCGVKTGLIDLNEVTVPQRRVKKLSFTVKSLRLDAVTGDMFGISRTKASELIRLGAVSLNYEQCLKTDAEINEGDIISVRGKGKGCVSSVGGKSKKDRLFIEAELYQ